MCTGPCKQGGTIDIFWTLPVKDSSNLEFIYLIVMARPCTVGHPAVFTGQKIISTIYSVADSRDSYNSLVMKPR